ncbi:DDE_3 domain-containing protein [Trichonephila clavipes]|nr:DDE_3 domain-containing protein [Trichonephila clavipes]
MFLLLNRYPPRTDFERLDSQGEISGVSPDLSLADHNWDVLGRQLQPSRSTDELISQLQRLWHDLSLEIIGDLIKSMPRRISAFITARGGFTTY